MIDVKELRIGNLVNFRDEDHVFEVTEIDKLGIRVKDSEQETWIEYDCFDGIKITEDILAKLGFKNNGARFSKPDNCVVSHDLKHVGIYIERHEDDIELDCPQYIHQLQNLYFALTGEELTIK